MLNALCFIKICTHSQRVISHYCEVMLVLRVSGWGILRCFLCMLLVLSPFVFWLLFSFFQHFYVLLAINICLHCMCACGLGGPRRSLPWGHGSHPEVWGVEETSVASSSSFPSACSLESSSVSGLGTGNSIVSLHPWLDARCNVGNEWAPLFLCLVELWTLGESWCQKPHRVFTLPCQSFWDPQSDTFN